jgi:hypothetical protein
LPLCQSINAGEEDRLELKALDVADVKDANVVVLPRELPERTWNYADVAPG